MAEPAFLEQIARYYASAESAGVLHEDVVYVLPNKRSAMFLKEHIHKTMSVPGRMPRLMTLRSFVSRCAGVPEAQARTQLFVLYNAYRKVLSLRGAEDKIRSFDSFVFWGDMILSDFDEIDRSMASADELFHNLHDLKEIQSDYLDDDQKAIIRRVWGESRLTAEAERFWLHMPEDDSDSERKLSARFLFLWEILSPLYHTFKEMLAGLGVATVGDQYRMAVDSVKELTAETIPAHTHYVFVGFNDVCTAELLIFDRLKQLGIASFFWDTAPIKLFGSAIGKPLERLAVLAKAFPMPGGFYLEAPAERPVVDVYSVPSNMFQAKAAGQALTGLVDNGYTEGANAINTAVVLPDQNLLMPLMFSIPRSVEAVNVSMGLSYSSTTFAALLQAIVSMQMRARRIRGVFHFYFEDVARVLNHPHIRLIDSDGADNILADIKNNKLFNIDAETLVREHPAFSPIFRPVHALTNLKEVSGYLLDLFDWISKALENSAGGGNGFEAKILQYFRKEIELLTAAAFEHTIEMTDSTFLRMFERMLNHAGLPVNGSPLRGLQVLGVLETRALDFDNVAILSMNERIFPRRQYTRTMIPNSLRHAYGLPDFENLEWTYAYCFYRLIARAKRVALFYDARSGGVGGSEMSRYITQIQYLVPDMDVVFHNLGMDACGTGARDISIEKTPEVLAQLDRFRAGGPLRLSASALNTYRRCPLQFYLQYVRGMRGDDELVDYLSASDYGTLVHNLIQQLFEDMKGRLIDATAIESLIDSRNRTIDDKALAMVVERRYRRYGSDESSLPAEARLAAEMIAAIARSDLRAEAEAYCNNGRAFTFVDAEMEVAQPWQVSPSLCVNWKMSIDRVDRTDRGLRFIDFKTGNQDVSAADINSVLKYSHRKEGMFQVFTYCQTYLDIVDSQADIEPVIHPVRELSQALGIKPMKVKTEITSYGGEFAHEFAQGLRGIVESIFDPAVKFGQCCDAADCRFCSFLSVCGRTVPQL